MKKKLVSVLVASAMVAGILSGCGSKAEEKNETATTEASEEGGIAGQEITFAIALADEEWDVMNKIFDMFKEETGCTVKGLQVENADIEGKVESLAAAGKAEIDIVAPDNMLLAGLVNKGLVMDLSEYESLIPDEIPDNLYEDFKVDGKTFYFPFRPNVKMQFYDEDKFNEYGLETPKTWEDIEAVGKTLYDNEGIARIGYQGKSATVMMFEMIRSFGGDPVVLNDEASVKAFTILQNLWKYTSPEVTTTSYAAMNQYLADGTFAYGENWPYCSVVLVKDNGKTNMKAYVGPAGSEGVNKVLGGNVAAICANTEHKEASIQFLEYLMSLEVQQVFTTDMGWIPARSDAVGVAEEWLQEYLNVAMEAMEYAEPRPILPYWSEVDKAILDAYTEIVVNQNPDIQGVLDTQHNNIEAAKAAVAK